MGLRCAAMLAAILVAALLPAPAALGAQGTLDPSFARRGWDEVAVPGRRASFTSVIVEPDGSIVAAGTAAGADRVSLLVARWRADGSRDPGFGTGGVALIDAPGEVSFAAARGIVVRPGPRYVVAGYAASLLHSVVVQLRPDGTPDPAFAAGGFASVDLAPGAYDAATAIVDAGQGRIGALWATAQRDRFLVVRLAADGAPDPTFGTAGVAAMTPSPPSESFPVDLALLPDGSLIGVAWARVVGDTERDAVFAQVRPDGTPDAAFGAGGMLRRFSGAFVQGMSAANGRVTVVGVSGPRFLDPFAARILSDGTVDPGFAPGGIAGVTQWWAIAEPDAGRSYLAGAAIAPVTGAVSPVLARLKPDGGAFPAFGTLGRADLEALGWGYAYAVAPGRDDTVVIAGDLYDLVRPQRAYVARVRDDAEAVPAGGAAVTAVTAMLLALAAAAALGARRRG